MLCVCIGFYLVSAGSHAQQAIEDSAAFPIESELLLELLLEGRSLEITVLAYQRDDRVYLALGELMDAIRFPVNTDAATGQAGGWFITEEREFLLDLSQNLVISDENRFNPGTDVAVFEGQIFVALSALESWFPLSFEPLIRQLALNVEPLEAIPLQESLRRRYGRVFSVGAVTREPELPFQETPYRPIGRHSTDLRVNTSSVLQDGDDDTTDLQGGYSLLSRGDLAWMTSTIALTGTDDDEISNGRIKLERNLQQPFLDLDYVEIGDVDAGNRGLLVRGGGAQEGSTGTFTNESIDLRGDIPPDWEVELYRNGILVDVQVVGSEAQYEFLEVPLEFGENRFEFVFYGPFGEEERDERIVFSGDGLEFGDVSYTLSAVEDGESVIDGFQASQKGTEGTGRYRASFNLGLGASTTARVNVDSFELEGERLEDASLGLSTSFSKLQTSLGYNRRERALDDATAQVRGRLGEKTNASVRYTEFLVGDLESDLVPSNRALWSAGASLSSRIFDNPFSIDASQSERESGSSTFVNLGTTIPTPWVRLSKAFFYQREELETNTDEQAGGSFNFSVDHNPWRFRSGGTYNISPESEFSSVFVSADIQLDRQMRLNFDVRHRPEDNYTNYRMGFNWGLDYVQISPQVIYDSNERWVGLVSLSTSFSPRPGRYMPAIDRLSQTGSGAAHARAFLDDNGDGIWNDNERGLPGVRVDAVQSYRSAQTASDGNAYLTRLRNDRVTDIAIDPSSLPEFDLNASSPGVSVRPRPGSWSTVDFPVIRTMELEGYVFQGRTGAQEPAPAPRVLVRLMDMDGEIVSQQRTVFDGFYLFSDVAPGTYSLVLRDELEDRLVEKPGQVRVTSAGGVIRDLNFTIVPESRALMGLGEPSNPAKREGPRIIAPIIPEDVGVTSEPLPEDNIVPVDRSESGVELTPVSPVEDDLLPDGNWHVQFGAFSEEDNARRRWDELQETGVLPDRQRAWYDSVGNLVRLLTDTGLPEKDARALCDQVKASGAGDCLVRQLED
jgi:hypothetical protein